MAWGVLNGEGREGPRWVARLSADGFVCLHAKPAPARTFWAGGLSATGTHIQHIVDCRQENSRGTARQLPHLGGGWAGPLEALPSPDDSGVDTHIDDKNPRDL